MWRQWRLIAGSELVVDTTFPLFSPSGSRVVAPALLVGESMQLMPIIETGLVGAECQLGNSAILGKLAQLQRREGRAAARQEERATRFWHRHLGRRGW